MAAYYNEIDPYAAQWLRNLIDRGLIAQGDVDERSIEDVHPSDLKNYAQCHFFAGIGIWSYALRKAGWPDDKPVWTGSCPCQPFSSAGKGDGFADERHLWPAWNHLIEQCRPAIVFGEQVASKNAEPWIDLVSADLEALGYAVGAVPFPAASVGAPHIRDRLYWVADAEGHRRADGSQVSGSSRQVSSEAKQVLGARYRRSVGRVADAERQQRDKQEHTCVGTSGSGSAGGTDASDSRNSRRPSPTDGFWRDADWLLCRDGKFRPVEPGTFPLAHGAPARVGRLRAYGNAIVAPQAQVFIECVMDWLERDDL